MNQSKISVRYAKAVFETAKEQGILERLYSDFNLIGKSISENKEFYHVITSPVIKSADKINLLSTVYKAQVAPLTMRFLEMLVENSREAYISDIARNFAVFYRTEKHIKEVVLTTPTGIDTKITDKVADAVAIAYKSGVEIKEELKPEMIGGVIVRIDNLQLDMSVATQLREIKETLKSESYKKKI
jgi:F-type H+-transporting ATPase subunit delta